MKICYLANASSVHTIRWANHFSSRGHDVEIVSLDRGRDHDLDPRVLTHVIHKRWPLKLDYFLSAPHVRNILQRSKPDIVHAHYASSYGTLGRLCGFHPCVLSVWGSDVYEFARRSAVHRGLIEKNLAVADYVCSTSHVMAAETQKYCNRPITITPFGVSCDRFLLLRDKNERGDEFVIGTVKTLEPPYGIEYLIRSFALLAQQYRTSTRLRLVIAGEGYLRMSLQKLARDLGVESLTEFLGAVPHCHVPRILNQFSVFAALSNSESFGVAVLEASACQLPVVATSVGNLPEIVRNGVTGFIVPPRDPEAAAGAFSKLLVNRELRKILGCAGRQFVLENYEWSVNVSRMERLYESILN